MGLSSSKKSFFGIRKKKEPPLRRAWSKLKRALPNKKRKRKRSLLPLDKLTLDNLRREERSPRKFSLAGNRKESISIKTVSSSNPRKESVSLKTLSLGKKAGGGGGIGRAGEQIQRKISIGNIKKSSPINKRFTLGDLKL